MSAEETAERFQDTPEGWAQRWQVEFAAAWKAIEPWHTKGEQIDKRFRDEGDDGRDGEKRWNLFTSDTQTFIALLYGQTPQASVDRRFADASDDVARVAAEILERLLNTDIEREDDGFATALQHALMDRLLPGMGNARVRYDADFEKVETPAMLKPDGSELAPAVSEDKKTRENVEIDYVHWKDQRWSPARVFHEARWWAFRAEMSREALIKRFPEHGKLVPLNAKKKSAEDAKKDEPWDRAEVWEIWSKEHKEVFHYVEGYSKILDRKPDPLGLTGFWPFPKPMAANLTTSTIVPRPDYVLAQDQYNEIDTVSTRISLLVDAVRAAGVYDKSSPALKQLLTGKGNALYPVDNWAMFAEKGGVKGVIDWLPLDQIVNAITVLRDQRRESVDELHQVRGMADIMRGQASAAGTSATEQSIKAKFGSVRVQHLQDEFARFASDLQRLKAEIIAKHFDAATILERCNCVNTPDAALAPQAVELIKSRLKDYRVQVKPESVSLQDFAAIKTERMEVLTGISAFLTSAAPIAQAVPGSMPHLLQMLQWTVAGLRGASGIEGVLDQAIAASKKAAAMPQQAQPDPKLITQQLKGQQDQAKIQAELQADITRTQVEVQADAQREQNQAQWNVREQAAKTQIVTAAQMSKPKNGVKP